MKKKLVGAVIVLLLVVTAAGAGCTLPTTTSPSPTTTSPSPTVQASKDLTLTVTPQGEATTIEPISKADAGNKFVLYNAVLKNINVKNLTVNPFWFDMRLSNGSSVGIDLFATVSSKGYFALTNGTQPGDTVNGTIVFEIAQTAKPVSIEYDDFTYNATANL